VLRQHFLGCPLACLNIAPLEYTKVITATLFECYFSTTGFYFETPKGVGTAPFENNNCLRRKSHYYDRGEANANHGDTYI